MKYIVTSITVGNAESPRKLKADTLKDIRATMESKGEDANNITTDDIILHRIIVEVNDSTEYEIWEAIGDERPHKKKFNSIEDKSLYLRKMLMRVG